MVARRPAHREGGDRPEGPATDRAGYPRGSRPKLIPTGNIRSARRQVALVIGADPVQSVWPPSTDFVQLELGGRAMLRTVAIVLVVLWLLGAFVVPVGGSLIHLLLVIALIAFIWEFIGGRRGTA